MHNIFNLPDTEVAIKYANSKTIGNLHTLIVFGSKYSTGRSTSTKFI